MTRASLPMAASLLATAMTMTSLPASGAAGHSLEARVDEVFAEWNKPDTPGCALSVMRDGKPAYERGYGMANLDYHEPITPDTVFYIASMSKQFTAAAVALLAEEGKISLGDDLRKYVPEIPAYEKTITIANLVHHTSGLRDYLGLWHDAGRSYADSIPEKEAIALIAKQDKLEFTPGSAYRYSNSNYFLLSVIVKRASGKSLRQYAEERIFAPLGMRSTHFHDDATLIVPLRASAYFRRDAAQGGGLALFQSSFDLVGDGGLLTTVRDFQLWDRNFYHNVLGRRGQKLIDQLLSTEPLSDGKPNDYAFGVVPGEYRGLRSVGHSGNFLAFSTDFIRIPERRLTVVVYCNSDEAEAKAMSRKVLDLYLDEGR